MRPAPLLPAALLPATLLGAALLALAGCSKEQQAAGSDLGSAPRPERVANSVRRPGLWRMSFDATGEAPRQMYVCVDQAVERVTTPSGVDFAPQVCAVRRVTVKEGGFDYRRECQTGSGRVTYTGSATGDLANEYLLDMRVEGFGPGGVAAPVTTLRTKGERIGRCPTGMQPGDWFQGAPVAGNLLKGVGLQPGQPETPPATDRVPGL